MTTPSQTSIPSQISMLPQNSFYQETVKSLKEDDFSLAAKELVCLKYSNCILVLFYNNNRESGNMIKIWTQVAAQVAGPIFAACNLFTEKRVAEAFVDLNNHPNHPLYWAKMQQTPFILSYRGGWPQAFYNGARDVETIGDYALALACRSDYTEHEQLGYGQQAENREFTTFYERYDKPPAKSSKDFTGENSIRKYDPRIQNVSRDTPEALVAQADVQQSTSSQLPPPSSQLPPRTIIPVEEVEGMSIEGISDSGNQTVNPDAR